MCCRSGGLLIVAFYLFACVAQIPPPPEKQSANQQAVYSRVASAAAALSAKATPELLRVFDSTEMRKHLKQCCASIATIPSTDLLEKLRREVRVGELVHNFEREGRDDQLQLGDASNSTFFPNLWELSFLNLTSRNSSHHHVGPEDCAERGLYGFEDFTAQKNGQPYPATYTEAANRPVYTAWNILRTDMGNPDFGSVCAVFSTDFVRNLTVVASIDTGIYEMACNDSFSKKHFFNGNCSKGARSVGTLEHFDHLILYNHYFWSGNLNVTMARLFGDTPAVRLAAVDRNSTIEYLEPDIAGEALYPSAIKMMIGSFADLFGTPKGRMLQVGALYVCCR
jgi:hypothetical protein